ncbi:MAG: DegT/DnrJ/EryC1/StrS family aminotransferase [Planctomycetota bacterium]|nr:DegT/DnrJ/EryC1/StrS family aminotransferase [Planctomycetota bacterium]
MAAAGKGVPLCDIQISCKDLRPSIDAAVARVLDSGQVILGPEVVAFEQEVAESCGVGFGVGCGSGSDALSLALHGLGIGQGDEVILPPYTFFATVGAVIRCGATPVFADIEAEGYGIDSACVADKITPRTRAIMAVHLFGQTADMEPLWRIAEKHDLLVIEDAAQSMGARYQDKPVGSLGALACLSFYPSKNLGGFGDSGMVVTNDSETTRTMQILRGHGMDPRYYHKMVGWNARIDALQAAMLRVKLPYLNSWIEQRRQAASRYMSLIQRQGLDGHLETPSELPNRMHTYNQFVVSVAHGKRDQLLQSLRAQSIGCEIYYPLPLHLQECLADMGHKAGDFPVSEAAAKSTLALPIFPGITMEQQEIVVGACAAFLRAPVRMAA